MPTPSDPRLLPFPQGEGRGEADLALCRATLYAALALGFRPATTETLERLTHPDAAAALADAARMFDAHQFGSSPLPVREACPEHSRRSQGEGIAARAVALAQPDADLEALSARHRHLFGHTARGEVPPYETEYGDEALFQQPQELSDLAGFMRAFGLVLRPEVHERIDHVSCECEFLSFLACKEAYAIDKGDAQMRAVTARATTLFLSDHLARFAPAFGRRLMRIDAAGFYGKLGALLVALADAECQRLGVAVGAQNLGLRPDPATVAAPMGCAADADGGCPFGTGAA